MGVTEKKYIPNPSLKDFPRKKSLKLISLMENKMNFVKNELAKRWSLDNLKNATL